MYHLLVSYSGWSRSSDSIDLSRAFEYTEETLERYFKPNGVFDIAQISRFPALFASETDGSGEQLARVGYINHISVSGRTLNLRYALDPNIPPLPNEKLNQLSSELGIQSFELSRTHWSIKDIDLFRILYEHHLVNILSPSIFSIEDAYLVDDDLVSVMMPFSAEFSGVYEAIQNMKSSPQVRCLRADDIWENDAVIQDIVSLICRSRIVICDCTGRNANVFYEAGIAHTLGKDVILVTQHEQDIPFDLRHLRYLKYLNNEEGRNKLAEELSQRVSTILGGRGVCA